MGSQYSIHKQLHYLRSWSNQLVLNRERYGLFSDNNKGFALEKVVAACIHQKPTFLVDLDHSKAPLEFTQQPKLLKLKFTNFLFHNNAGDFNEFLLKKPLGSVFFPSSVCGPDVIAWTTKGVLVTIGCRFYGRFFFCCCSTNRNLNEDEYEHNKRTTDPTYFYYKKDGSEPNPKCANVHQEFTKKVLPSLLSVPTISLVVAIPQVVTKKDPYAYGTRYIIPITLGNASILFPQEVLDILLYASNSK